MTSGQKIGPKSCPENCPAEAWELFCAAANGDRKTVRTIGQEKPNLMLQFVWYQSPLMLAFEGDYWYRKKNEPDPETSASDVIQVLRDNGAAYEFTAAVALDDLEFAKSQLDSAPHLARKLNEARRSPLYYASIRGHTDMVRLLLQHGADPNLPEHCAAKGKALLRLLHAMTLR